MDSLSEKPLILRWIGPALLGAGFLSAVQGLTIYLGGIELPGAPAEINEFIRATAKMIFPMGFAYMAVGFAFYKSRRFARPLFFAAHVFGGIVFYFVCQSCSPLLQRVFLGQVPGMAIITFVMLWYFYKKKNVVEYYQSLRA